MVNPIVADRPLVRLAGVSKAYREGERHHPVLINVNADIQRGECIALTGPSGSGKSTLLNVIAGIDVVDAGDVIIDGTSLLKRDEKSRTLFRRRHIGLVFQAFNLLPTLTVMENICLPLVMNKVPKPLHAARAQALLSAVGLADRDRRFPQELSGGEQQRVAIVRALIHQPEIVLADEPTGNLDADNASRVVELLLSLAREQTSTLLIATHSADIADYADGVWKIDHGAVVTDLSANDRPRRQVN